jgi:hypothetical protein
MGVRREAWRGTGVVIGGVGNDSRAKGGGI